MRHLVQSLALICLPISAQQAVSPVAFSESKHALTAFNEAGQLLLPVVRLQLDIVYPRGKKERGDLTVVYDPQNRHYLWRYDPHWNVGGGGFLAGMDAGVERVYAGPDALVDFYMPGGLFIMENRKQAGNLDAAESASIEEIRQGLQRFEGGYSYDAKEVGLRHAIGDDFACAPYPESGQNCGFGIKSIVSISRDGDNWRLVLRNRWDQEVILDSKFNLVSTKRLPAPPTE